MVVNVKRKELLSQVRKVEKAAAPGHPLNELAGILLETDGRAGIIQLTATNLEVSICSAMPAAVEKDGNAVIDARLLLNVLNLLPGEDVYMELKENGQLYISSEKSHYLFTVLQTKNYPTVDIPYPGDTVSVKGLKSLISRSMFAAAPPNPSRPALSCVKLTFSESGVQAVSCDGTCAVQVSGDPGSKGNISLLVPAVSLKLLASLAGDGDVYELGVTGIGGAVKNAVFSDGAMLFSARIVEGDYLDTDTLFQRIAPAASAFVSTDKLRRALDDISSVAGTDGKVEFSFGENGLILRGSGERGNAVSALDAVVVNATKERYYFTLKNLSSCVKVLRGEVTLNFTKEKMLEIRSDSMRFFQIGIKPDTIIKPEKEPRKKAAA